MPYPLPPSACGIYHLLKAGRVVYVGQSANVFNRLGSWITARPDAFDSFEVFPASRHELNHLEKEHIKRHDPPMNKEGRTRFYRGVNRDGLPSSVKKFGSLRAYFESLDPIVSGTDIRRAGVNLNNLQLMAMPDFPDPIESRKTGGCWRCYWRRDEVREWLEQFNQVEVA
jgi:hypothetical protein